MAADDGTVLAVFDEDGNYIATYWEIGDLISKPKMNKSVGELKQYNIDVYIIATKADKISKNQ